MDQTEALSVFDRLFGDVPGYRISHAGRAKLPQENRSTTYGEILSTAFPSILATVHPQAGEVFCDLGSGVGKAVFLAAMLFPFRRAFGVELISEMGTEARRLRQRFEQEIRPTLSGPMACEIDFLDGDFLETDLSTVNVAFMAATCFERTLMRGLARKLRELRPGARVICVGQSLREDYLQSLGSVECEMDWGMSFACFAVRR